MEEMMGIVANTGFPIAIAIFLLVRIENKLEVLSTAIHELSIVIKESHRKNMLE